MPHPPAPNSLVEFVLRHLEVRGTQGSLQDTNVGYVLQPRVLQTYNLIFTTRGRPIWVIDGQEYPLGPNVLLLVPPGVRHHGYSRTRRVRLVSLHVHALLPGGQDAFELVIPPRVQDVQPRSRLDRYLRGMIDEYTRLPRGPARSGTHIDARNALSSTLKGWAQLIVPELLRTGSRRGLLTHRPVEPLIAQVLDELNQRIDKPTDLQDLAAITGYSPQHLNRVFRRVLGVTPLKYLTRMRMQRAAGLLAEGQLTVRAIARLVAIDDPYYFSRLFKEHYRQSPAQYRAAAAVGAPPHDSENPS